MRKRSFGNALIVLLAFSGLGCKGLTVDLDAVPDPADPGQEVKWTVTVRNDTQCPTVDTNTDPVPADSGLAIIFGFNPELDDFGAQEFCRLFMSCQDLGCFEPLVEQAMGPNVAAALSARANATTPEPGISPGTCEEVSFGIDGVVAFCVLDTIAPGETTMAMFTANAPDTGSRNAAQVALAFAPAEGEDCRPGTPIGNDQWILGGCFPLATSTPAPALSPIATGIAAGVLLIAGAVGVYRRRGS